MCGLETQACVEPPLVCSSVMEIATRDTGVRGATGGIASPARVADCGVYTSYVAKPFKNSAMLRV